MEKPSSNHSEKKDTDKEPIHVEAEVIRDNTGSITERFIHTWFDSRKGQQKIDSARKAMDSSPFSKDKLTSFMINLVEAFVNDRRFKDSFQKARTAKKPIEVGKIKDELQGKLKPYTKFVWPALVAGLAVGIYLADSKLKTADSKSK